MRNTFSLLITCALLIYSNLLKSQDSLLFLNGVEVAVKIKKIKPHSIEYSFLDEGKKVRERSLMDLFSYKKEGQKSIVHYKYDPEIGNIYTVPEMKNFILGEQAAEKFYNPRFYNYLGLFAGAMSGYYMASGEAAMIASPLIYSSIILIPKVSVRADQKNIARINNLEYRTGYRRLAKGKKFLGGLMFSAIGLASSFTLFELTD